MITPKLIEEIIATYRRHGWQLQRVLLRAATRASIGERETVFDHVHVQDSDIDALWFSRPPNQGREAWELRMIAEQQYDYVLCGHWLGVEDETVGKTRILNPGPLHGDTKSAMMLEVASGKVKIMPL